MLRPYSIFVCLSALCLATHPLPAEEAAAAIKKAPTISLLPNGSVLKGVLLPRYDNDRKLVGTLKAAVMTLVDEETIEGEAVIIRFYQPDQTLRGQVDLTKATFNKKEGRLDALEPVQITADRLVAKGTGLTYAFEEGKGFIKGPVTTWIKAPPETAMHITPRTATAALLAGTILHTTLIAAPPAFISPEELQEIKKQAASHRPQIDEQSQQTRNALVSSKTEIHEASKAARAFLNDPQTILIADKEKDAPAAPLEVNPGPNDTIITCDDGMYFDADAGILVYLGNVKVTNPQFELSGANELKIFFEKKDPPADDAPKPDDGLKIAEGPAGFGDVQKIIATGTVRFLQRAVGGREAIEASGGLLNYNVARGEIIISERYPWVKQGTFFALAKEPNLTLRILRSGSFSTQGNWEMGGNLNLNR